MDSDALAREALIALSRLYPDRFVLVGGAALHLLHGSPRSSADLDFAGRKKVSAAQLRRLAEGLQRELSRLPSLGAGHVFCRVRGLEVELVVDEQVRLSIEFPSFAAMPAATDRRLVTGDSLRTELILAPTLDALLFSKASAFLKRSALKGRDAFDIWFLRERGARLDPSDFDAWLRWEDIESSGIEARLSELTEKRLKSDVSRYLPRDLAARLEAVGYAPVIESVRTLLAPWLED